jgi:hypothetical protein
MVQSDFDNVEGPKAVLRQPTGLGSTAFTCPSRRIRMVSPTRVKNCSKLSTVRSLPIHSSRVQPCSKSIENVHSIGAAHHQGLVHFGNDMNPYDRLPLLSRRLL